MRYAETGFNLEIDLSRGSIERVATDPKLTELHLGGQGTAGKILWDRVPPEVEPFSPENLLIFSTGLLQSTPVPGANRTSVDTFSPQTNLYSHSLFGGFFGPELKHAGYDKIIIRGRPPTWFICGSTTTKLKYVRPPNSGAKVLWKLENSLNRS
jgi:aldehyde:ferredoxin oxidoreductase